jgi:acetate kinase
VPESGPRSYGDAPRHLGVSIDERLNAAAEPDIDIGSDDADVRTLVIASREDLEITAGVEQVLTGSARS